MSWTKELMKSDVGLGTLLPEPADKKAARNMRAKLRILRAVAELGTFTQPEVVAASGASYEMVKKVLRGELEAKTVVKLDQTESRPNGRPRILWQVADRALLDRRLAAAACREAEDAAATLSLPTEVPALSSPLLDAALSAAEDRLVFAVASDDADDAAGLALDALVELDRIESEWSIGTALSSANRQKPGQQQKVAIPEGRAQVIEAVSAYLASDEALGVAGPLWRTAFDTVGGFDHARQAGLHKLLMTGLVDIAEQRRPASASGGGTGRCPGCEQAP